MSLSSSIDVLEINNADKIKFIGTSNTIIDTTTGRVGIGMDPTNALDVKGNVYVSTNIEVASNLKVSNINFTGAFTKNGATFISSPWTITGNDLSYATGNVGVGTPTPGTTLDVDGDLTVTGNVMAGYLYGDGSNISGIASNLDQIANNGNVTSNTVQFSNAITGLVTTANVEVGGELTVSGNTTMSGNVNVTGNVVAGYLYGDGSNISGIASNLDQITNNGNVTSNTVQFSNAITGLVTTANVEVGGELTVSGNTTMSGNVNVTGNVVAGYLYGDGSNISGIASNLDQIVNNGNVTSNTVQFSNVITGLVTTANVEVGGELTVSGNVNVTGNVVAGYLYGDGSNISGIASNLDQIVNNGNVTSNTVQFSNVITGLVTTANVEVGGELTVSGNTTMSGNVNVTGNVVASYLYGDGSNISGIASNLDQIVNNGNVTSNTVQFSNVITGLVTTANVEVGGELTVSGNTTMSGNVNVTGNVVAGYLYGDGSNISGIASNLDQIVNNGNVTSNTVQFSNAITGLVTTANVEVGGELTVSGNVEVTGNVVAGYLYGDGSNISGIASNLDQIVNNGNVTSNTVQFSNVITGLVTTANIEVGGELTVSGNVEVTGNVVAGYLYGDGSNISGIASNLDQIVNNGNVTSNTVQFSNAITGLVTTANVEVGGELTVSGNTTITGNTTMTGNVIVDTDTLFVDSMNDRVGVGTAIPGSTLDVAGDVKISGNLNVVGTTTTLNIDNFRVKDPIIELAKNNTGSPIVDLGIVMTRPSGSSNVGIIFDESTDTLEIGYTQNSASDSTITMQSVAVNPISVNVNGTISGNGSGITDLDVGGVTTGTLAVVRGGTGTTTSTGTTNVVLSDSPTLTGTLSAADASFSGDISAVDGTFTGAVSGTSITDGTGTLSGGAWSGSAASADTLTTSRTIGGVPFDGSTNISLPGVDTGGNQNTTGSAASADTLTTARTIGGVSFDGSADIVPTTFGVATFGATKTFVVTVAPVGGSNRFHIDGVDRPALSFHEKQTYIFDQSDSSNQGAPGHPIAFSQNVNGGTPYNTGVTSVGTPGQAGAKTTFTVPVGAPSNLFYYCVNHPTSMGSLSGAPSVVSTEVEVIVSGDVSVSSNLEVSNINFTGALTQNGVAFGSSPWTSNVNDIYYTTGKVGIGLQGVPDAQLHIVPSTSGSVGATTAEWGSLLEPVTADDAGIDDINYCIAKSVATDSGGNVYVTGLYGHSSGNWTVGNAITLPSTGYDLNEYRSFILKYNSSGIIQWAKSIASNSRSRGDGIVVDSSGNVCAVGRYYSTNIVSLGLDAYGSSVSLPSTTTHNPYIIKYSASGTIQWANGIACNLDTLNGDESIAVDSSGNVYISGSSYSTSSVSLGNGISLPSSTNYQSYTIKYNATGTAQWANMIPATSGAYALGIGTDSSGNVIVTGYYTSSSTVSVGNGKNLPSTTAFPDRDAFIVKYDTGGTAQWANSISDSGTSGGNATVIKGLGVATDSSGNVIVTGHYNGTLSFTPTISLPNSGGYANPFIVKYNASGIVDWANSLPTIYNSGYGQGITVDSSGNIYVCGYYESSTAVSLGNGLSLPSTVYRYGYIIIYDTNGTAQRFEAIQGSHDTELNGITLDASYNIIVCGVAINLNAPPSSISLGNGVSLTRSTTYNNPAISDDETGLVVKYSTLGTANKALLVAGNTEVGTANLFIDTTTSRVGIGTATPGYSLDVTGDINFTGALTQNGTTFSGGGGSPWTTTGNDLSYTTGQVGVGINTPSARLHITPVPASGGGSISSPLAQWGSLQEVYYTDTMGYTPGGDITTFVEMEAVAVDPNTGDIYAVGDYKADSTWNLGNSVTLPGTMGSYEARQNGFIIKYSASGTIQWAKNLVPTTGVSTGLAVTVDSFNGDVLVSGEYYSSSSSVSLGNSITLPIATSNYGYLIKYNSGGTPQWANVISADYSYAYGVTTDSSGNVYLSGQYRSNGSSSSLGNSVVLPNTGTTQDPFVIKYYPSGVAQWAKTIAADYSNSCNDVALDSSGNVYITGTFRSTSSIALGNGQYLTSAANNSTFLVKYNSSGAAQWGKNIGLTGQNFYGRFVTTDSSGNVYVSGHYSNTSSSLALGNSVSLPNTTSAGPYGTRTFIIKYNASGTAQWSKMINTTSSNSNKGLAIDSNDNIYIDGYYNSASSTTLGNSFSLPASSHMEAFIIIYDTGGITQGFINVSGTSSLSPGINPSRIAVDSNGNIIIGGSLENLVNSAFDIGNSVSVTRTTTPNTNAMYNQLGFVFKYSTQPTPNTALLVEGNTEVGTANLFVNTTTSMVGVGTATPGYTLDVAGNINFTGALTQNGATFGSSPWNTVNTNEIHYSLGNVGIGLSNPNYDLDVAGNINFTGTLTQNGTTYGGSSGGGGGQWNTVNTNEIHYSLGNVGIGTTDPSTDLQIGNTSTKTSDTYLTIASDGGSSYAQGIRLIHHGTDDSNMYGWRIRGDDTDDHFHINYISAGSNSASALTIRNNNNVGIGLSNPSYPLHVSGDIYATGNVTAYSDKRKKTNLQIISDALNKVSNLNGYTYEKDGTKYTGLIAQEVLEVLPEAVVGNEEEGYGLAYGNMVGILVEAIKELTNEVKNLKEKLYS